MCLSALNDILHWIPLHSMQRSPMACSITILLPWPCPSQLRYIFSAPPFFLHHPILSSFQSATRDTLLSPAVPLENPEIPYRMLIYKSRWGVTGEHLISSPTRTRHFLLSFHKVSSCFTHCLYAQPLHTPQLQQQVCCGSSKIRLKV